MGRHALKRRWRGIPVLAVLAALGMVAAPAANADEGVDTSNWQGYPNWAQVRASGRSFAILRQGQGTAVDPTYVRNEGAARNAGLRVGTYQYVWSQDGATTARIQIGNLHDYRLGDVISLDLEGPYATGDRACSWAQTARQLMGPEANLAMYMAESTANGPINFSCVRAQGVWLWVAVYGSDNGANHGYYTPAWPDTRVHQYTSRGRVPGIAGDVDLDAALASAFPTSGSVVATTPVSGNSTGVSIVPSNPTIVLTQHPAFWVASVPAVQAELRRFGYQLAVDGWRGEQTDLDVKSFQISQGLTPDGIVGDHTWTALTTSPTVLAVDGAAGQHTVARAQQLAGTVADGVVSGQNAFSRAHQPALLSKTAGIHGSAFIWALQRALGIHQDGQLGPATIMRLQYWLTIHHYGTLRLDGILGPQTVAAWQRALNTGHLF